MKNNESKLIRTKLSTFGEERDLEKNFLKEY